MGLENSVLRQGNQLLNLSAPKMGYSLVEEDWINESLPSSDSCFYWQELGPTLVWENTK